ncbi:MAG: cytochrome c [Gammaproteobacteria bacterium]|nr:cytochrome c [Gammaproteobacteria bacterium]
MSMRRGAPPSPRRLDPHLARRLGAALALFFVCGFAAAAPSVLERGRMIYEEGMLPSGQPLHGSRANETPVDGRGAACAQCHRKSGMGSVEGDIIVPPITGKALFNDAERVVATMDPRRGKAFNQAHADYDEETLTAAIREGTTADGRTLGVMMPRYDLGPEDSAAIVAYLKQLSRERSPGAEQETIHFATVIAPGVAPARRQAMLDTLRRAFDQKNASTVPGLHRARRRHMVTAAELVLGTERKWALEVWELKGDAKTWGAQLGEFYRRQPAFALISGISDSDWAPVHEFCEAQHLPLWFPSVPAPPVKSQYGLYFSQGVRLEAAVAADAIAPVGGTKPSRVIAIRHDDEPGRSAGAAFAAALARAEVKADERVLGTGGLASALAGVRAGDHVMLFARPDDLAATQPVAGATYLVSATLGRPDYAPLPAAWRAASKIVYPYELPAKRRANLAYFRSWSKMSKVEIVDEPLQSEVFFAISFLTNTTAEMLDNLYRDYLIERAENMLSRREASKAEQEARDRAALGVRKPGGNRVLPNAKRLDAAAEIAALAREGGPRAHQSGTTVYPRLSLGPGQRHASKGAYVVRYEKPDDTALVAEGEWTVP